LKVGLAEAEQSLQMIIGYGSAASGGSVRNGDYGELFVLKDLSMLSKIGRLRPWGGTAPAGLLARAHLKRRWRTTWGALSRAQT